MGRSGAHERASLETPGRLQGGDLVSDTDLDELGPVDYLVVEFPADTRALRSLDARLASLLAEEDVEAVVTALEPGSSAGLLVWENTWAAPFASAVRRSGGQLVASDRIPIQAVVGAIEAEEEVARQGA